MEIPVRTEAELLTEFYSDGSEQLIVSTAIVMDFTQHYGLNQRSEFLETVLMRTYQAVPDRPHITWDDIACIGVTRVRIQ